MCDYRPISLIGCAYKVITKILATRLFKVMPKIISPNQTAFISGRQILDGVLIANEIVNYAKKSGMKFLLFKVDFEKAFDCVNWSISVLVNGSPMNEFSMECGLRQRDPLSPFLFLIVAEALQVLTLEACEKEIFHGLSLYDSGENLSLLQYANDALFFGEWSDINIKGLINMLSCFFDASGLGINISKCRIYSIGVPENEVERVSQIINCSYDKLPLTYLGLPVGKDMSRVNAWNDVVES
ncbi:reverse transcriptase domain, reverse transcriptase zinc-binding domain protein [Tanacetum coccineum]